MGLGALQPGHLFVILAIVLLIFGPGKLGDIGKSLGQGLKELKKGAELGDHKGTAQATSRICPSCNSTVALSDKFCGGCGKTMDAPSKVA